MASPGYDALTPEERHRIAEENPLSFLHVMRSEIDFPADQRPSREQLLQTSLSRLQDMIESGVLVATDGPALFVYRIEDARHRQTGVVAALALAGQRSGRIRPHEQIRPDHAEYFAEYMETVKVGSIPVSLTYRHAPAVTVLVDELTDRAPTLEVTSPDGVIQTVWMVGAPDEIDQLVGALDRVGAFYVTDGHHRLAAATRYADARRRQGAPAGGPADHVLALLVPDDEVQEYGYNRRVHLPAPPPAHRLLESIRAEFNVQPVADPRDARPDGPGRLGMYLEGGCYLLEPRSPVPDDPVARLDVQLLQDRLLGPILGIEDPSSDHRLDFVPAMDGIDPLRAPGVTVGFALFPPTVEDLMAVADAGRLMPPKSTWFVPKPRAGLIVRLVD